MKFPLRPLESARVVISIRGSAPGERMKINGVYLSESWYACSRLNGGGSMYSAPNSLVMSFCVDGVNLSGRITLVSSNFKKGMMLSHLPGNLASNGESALYTAFHYLEYFLKSSIIPAKLGNT